MLVSAVAIAPAIEVSVGLVLFVSFIVALGLLAVHRGIITPALLGLANLLDRISVPIPRHHVHLFGPVSAAFRWAVREGDHALSALVLVTEQGAVWLFHALAQQARWLGQLLGDMAETMEHGFARILFLFPPAAALWIAVKTAQQVAHLPARLRAFERRVAHDFPRDIAAAKAAALAAVAAVRSRVAVLAHAVTVALPHRIDLVGDAVRWVGRTLRAARTEIRRHARLLTAAGSAALVAAALARLGLGWLRCPRIGRLGRRACGIDADLLEDLLLGTLAVAGTISLVETAKDLQSITGAAVDFTHALIREV